MPGGVVLAQLISFGVALLGSRTHSRGLGVAVTCISTLESITASIVNRPHGECEKGHQPPFFPVLFLNLSFCSAFHQADWEAMAPMSDCISSRIAPFDRLTRCRRFSHGGPCVSSSRGIYPAVHVKLIVSCYASGVGYRHGDMHLLSC